MNKPTRPFKNLEDFRSYILTYYSGKLFNDHPELYPCMECHGAGRIWDPNSSPCPIEGNKMRDRIKCPDCKGSRTMPIKDFRHQYNFRIAEYKKKLKKYNEHQLIVKSAKCKIALAGLTRKEKDAIGL